MLACLQVIVCSAGCQRTKSFSTLKEATGSALYLAVPSGEVYDLGFPPIFDLRRITPRAAVSRRMPQGKQERNSYGWIVRSQSGVGGRGAIPLNSHRVIADAERDRDTTTGFI